MFKKKLNINEDKKYDATKVSTEGITVEELKKIEKKNAKLIKIYKALSSDKQKLTKLDLALAMDGFTKAAGDDGKLSKDELNDYAKELNQKHNLNIDGKDLKQFLKSIRKYTKKDTKESTQGIIQQAELEKQEANAKAAEEKRQREIQKIIDQTKEALPSYLDDIQKKGKEVKAQEEADAARKKDLNTPKSYIVQNNDKLDDLLKRSLEAREIEVNEENLAQAREEFIKNNPKALHGAKGNEYLYAGDEIKIAGNLEYKDSKDAVIEKYKQSETKKAKDNAPAPTNTKNESPVAPKEKSQAPATPESKEEAPATPKKGESPVAPKEKSQAPATPPKGAPSPIPPTSTPDTKPKGPRSQMPETKEKGSVDTKPENDKKHQVVKNEHGAELHTKNYDENGNLVSRTKTLSNGTKAYYPLDWNSDKPIPSQQMMTAGDFIEKFDKELISTSYINQIADKYGEEAAKEFIKAYDEQAKKNGKETVKEQIVWSSNINKERRIKLGLETPQAQQEVKTDLAKNQNSNTISSQDFIKEFDSKWSSVSYINEIADKYGDEKAKELIKAYDEQAKKNGTKTIKEQLIMTGNIDYNRRINLGLAEEYKPPQKDKATVEKQITTMKQHPAKETLPNGYSRRDIPGANDGYFDNQGNKISKEVYERARGPQSDKINNMSQYPIMEQLDNGYTKRSLGIPSLQIHYFDAEGNRITEEQYKAAQK